MRPLCLSLAISLLLVPACRAQRQASGVPRVRLVSGQLEGKRIGGLAVFEGIPFAQPPVGRLRWREPQPVLSWAGVRDATQPAHPCMQSLHGTDDFLKPLAAAYGVPYTPRRIDPSEDCLYLNVWTPALQPGARLPVMVWLHGGSNRVGSGSDAGYDGSSLAAHGVIVVTLNYRLGVMGFFAHPELTAESLHHNSGNYGLLDQIAALGWVRQNIAQFGGDPGNVTLFGESAGSIDATDLMTSPLAANLFRRVIAESGPAFGLGPSQTLAHMEAVGSAVGKAAGGPAGAQLETLRKLPAAQVAQIETQVIAAQFQGADPNGAVVDGWALPQSPARAFAAGRILPVDLLVGLNAREFSAFRVVAAAAAKLAPQPPPKASLSDEIGQVAGIARPLYGNWTGVAVATYVGRILVGGSAAIDRATNDIAAACPIGAEAALTMSAGRRAYVYRFERSVPGKGEAELGAFHSLELPYVFGTFDAHTFSWLPFGATDRRLSQTIESYWTNFAKTGDPNGAGLPRWTPWNADREPFLAFTESGDAAPQQGFSPMYCHLAPQRLKELLANE